MIRKMSCKPICPVSRAIRAGFRRKRAVTFVYTPHRSHIHPFRYGAVSVRVRAVMGRLLLPNSTDDIVDKAGHEHIG